MFIYARFIVSYKVNGIGKVHFVNTSLNPPFVPCKGHLGLRAAFINTLGPV